MLPRKDFTEVAVAEAPEESAEAPVVVTARIGTGDGSGAPAKSAKSIHPILVNLFNHLAYDLVKRPLAPAEGADGTHQSQGHETLDWARQLHHQTGS